MCLLLLPYAYWCYAYSCYAVLAMLTRATLCLLCLLVQRYACYAYRATVCLRGLLLLSAECDEKWCAQHPAIDVGGEEVVSRDQHGVQCKCFGDTKVIILALQQISRWEGEEWRSGVGQSAC